MEEAHATSNNNPANSNKGIWYVLGIILLVLFIFGLASNSKKQPPPTTSTTTPAAQPTSVPQRPKTGSYGLTQQGTGKVTVNMDTAGRTVVSYNVVIQYNPDELTLGKIQSARPDFTVVQNEMTKGYIVIDGIKSVQSKNPTVLRNSPLLTIPYTAKTSGSHTIRIAEQHNKDEGKFYDENTSPYYPAGSEVTVQ